MIDRKTEEDIKSVKSFLEFWGRLHSLYKEIIQKEVITKEDEIKFLETKGIIGEKYDIFKGSLEFTYAPHTRLTDPVSDILALTSLHVMSEKGMKKTNDDWRDSYVFLNSILERLENKRRRLGQFSPVGVFFKRIWERSSR